jgi:tRNA(adenine34) deaminase
MHCQFLSFLFLSVILAQSMSFVIVLSKLQKHQVISRGHILRCLSHVPLEYQKASTESQLDRDEKFMKLAIRHAQSAYRDKEVPIGAILVDNNGTIVAASRNQVEERKDASAHAEIDCLRKASSLRDNWRLNDCTLYTTLEPCTMCFGAIQHFRVKRVVFGAKDLRLGACGSLVDLISIRHPFHQVSVTGGILEDESTILLRRFFQSLRSEKLRYASHDLGRGVAASDFLVDTTLAE